MSAAASRSEKTAGTSAKLTSDGGAEYCTYVYRTLQFLFMCLWSA